jgi:hypothetical protein
MVFRKPMVCESLDKGCELRDHVVM